MTARAALICNELRARSAQMGWAERFACRPKLDLRPAVAPAFVVLCVLRLRRAASLLPNHSSYVCDVFLLVHNPRSHCFLGNKRPCIHV